ncbi:MAG: ribonuclease III [Puniceicoccaceae bacterium]
MLKREIRALQKTLAYRFKKPELLELALTHPSFVQGTAQSDRHNQRLEFLGDSILGMIVSVELYKAYPDKREGFLTKARSTLCHGKNLTQMARELGLEPHLQLGKGEQRAQSKDRSQILGDCLEAVIGAVYLDGGYKSARNMVLKWVRSQLDALESEMETINFKGALQEWSQSHCGTNRFEYELVRTAGPDHAKEFTVQVLLGNEVLASATGFSKKEAESGAAELALARIRSNEAHYLSRITDAETGTPPSAPDAELHPDEN